MWGDFKGDFELTEIDAVKCLHEYVLRMRSSQMLLRIELQPSHARGVFGACL